MLSAISNALSSAVPPAKEQKISVGTPEVLLKAGADGDALATDEQLSQAMECERSVYVAGEAVRKAFAPATKKWD